MKTLFKFLLPVVFCLTACNESPNGPQNTHLPTTTQNPSVVSEIPAMHDKVVAYLRVDDRYSEAKFIDDEKTMKSWFPVYVNVLYNEECNYFAAIIPAVGDLSYMILSQDMTLHSIHSNPISKGMECISSSHSNTTYYQAMLICDDKLGTIKNGLDFNSAIDYIDKDWDCNKEGAYGRGAYFTHASSSSTGEPVVATKMPVMSDRVISYQGARWSEVPPLIEFVDFSRGIVSDAETLKSLFPQDYDEQKKECNYFAIYNSTSSTRAGYLVLADDMVLYSLVPNTALSEWCVETTDIFSEVMLVCDDKDYTFKNNINFNGTYVVPGWDCTKWETAPTKKF